MRHAVKLRNINFNEVTFNGEITTLIVVTLGTIPVTETVNYSVLHLLNNQLVQAKCSEFQATRNIIFIRLNTDAKDSEELRNAYIQVAAFLPSAIDTNATIAMWSHRDNGYTLVKGEYHLGENTYRVGHNTPSKAVKETLFLSNKK